MIFSLFEGTKTNITPFFFTYTWKFLKKNDEMTASVHAECSHVIRDSTSRYFAYMHYNARILLVQNTDMNHMIGCCCSPVIGRTGIIGFYCVRAITITLFVYI